MPAVSKTVERLEKEYGTIKLYSSFSGKMDSVLSANWTLEVLVPAVEESKKLSDEDDSNPPEWNEADIQLAGASELLCVDGDCSREVQESRQCERQAWPRTIYCENQARHIADRQCRNRADTLILYDSWAGNKQIVRIGRPYGITSIQIRPRLTSELQPLDVGFNRQYKHLVNRIVHQSKHELLLQRTTSREGIMNVHSLVWNQFSSPKYKEMIIWCWRKTDPTLYQANDLLFPNMVRVVQFSFEDHRCSVDGCDHEPFVRCSHCGRVLCLHHFLQRLCFHGSDGGDARNIDIEDAMRVLSDVDDESDEEMMLPDEREAEEIAEIEASFSK